MCVNVCTHILLINECLLLPVRRVRVGSGTGRLLVGVAHYSGCDGHLCPLLDESSPRRPHRRRSHQDGRSTQHAGGYGPTLSLFLSLSLSPFLSFSPVAFFCFDSVCQEAQCVHAYLLVCGFVHIVCVWSVNDDGSVVIQENPLAAAAVSAAASSATSAKGGKAASAVVTADYELFKQFNQFQQFQQFQQMQKQGQVLTMPASAPAVAAVAAMAATDAGVWVEQRNADTGRVFYVNSVTKEQTWVKPEGTIEMQTIAKP